MKNLTFIILFLSTMTFGQEISVRIDWQNLLWGSDVNEPGLNYKIGISDDFIFENVKFGMEYEVFSEIGYQQWTFAKFDYEIKITDAFRVNILWFSIPIGSISILPGFAFSQIYHETSYSHDAMTYALNLELTYALNDYLKLSIQANRESAKDISQMWRDSVYGGIIYKWN